MFFREPFGAANATPNEPLQVYCFCTYRCAWALLYIFLVFRLGAVHAVLRTARGPFRTRRSAPAEKQNPQRMFFQEPFGAIFAAWSTGRPDRLSVHGELARLSRMTACYVSLPAATSETLNETQAVSADRDIEEAYRHYFPMIERKCARMLKDDEEAQDIAQETFIRLSRERQVLRDPLTTTAWVYRTATRLAIDHIRRRNRRGELLEARGEEVWPKGEAAADVAIQTKAILSALATKIPEKEMTAALLARVDGMGQVEVAEVMKTSDRNVRRWLNKFDERVRKLLEAS